MGEAGARLYEVTLDECCDCLARIIIHLPQFGARASVEMLGRLSGLSDQVGAVLARLPARTLDAPEGESDDGEFTRRYLALISESLDTLELFGVRFERFTRPQTTLSVVYISLNVSDEGERARRNVAARAVPVSEWRDKITPGTMRVEAALHDDRLMLLRGEAGGGKSTLLRWLAITAARGSFSGQLSVWNGYVPFLIKLRSHAGGSLPRPEEFIDDIAGNLSGIMPPGWAHRCLTSGRVLLLVDGVRVPSDMVLDELLQRSGVLREPVPGRIDFVRRTVQEYLAAKQAADLVTWTCSSGTLTSTRGARPSSWPPGTPTTRSGASSSPESWLEKRHSRVLKLVAVACLETLPSVPDDLREELDQCLDGLADQRSWFASLDKCGPSARYRRSPVCTSTSTRSTIIITTG